MKLTNGIGLLFLLSILAHAQNRYENSSLPADVTVRLHITDSQLSFDMDCNLPVKGLQIELNNVAALPSGIHQVLTPLGNAQFEYRAQKKQLVFLIYDINGSTIPPGENIGVFCIPKKFLQADQITIKEVIVADENNNAVAALSKQIVYEPISDEQCSTLSVIPIPAVASYVHIGQNYPNPFRTSTAIPVSLDKAAKLSIAVYALDASRIATVTEGFFEAGSYTIEWDGRSNDGRAVPSGVYFLQAQSGEYAVVRRLLIEE